jgi:hypothetical protein
VRNSTKETEFLAQNGSLHRPTRFSASAAGGLRGMTFLHIIEEIGSRAEKKRDR